MAIIHLTKGLVTLVDDKLYEQLNKSKWYAQGKPGEEYAARRMKDHEAFPRALIYMHHEIKGLYPADLYGKEIDHVNGDRLDNTLENLEVVTHFENLQSYALRSGRTGLTFDRTNRKWKAYIDPLRGSPIKKRINVGTYTTRHEAEEARAIKLIEIGMTR